MATFTSYNSYEEMQKAEANNRAAADDRVLPWQAETNVGDYVVAVAHGVACFSEVLQRYGSGGKMRNYRFTKSYSVLCEAGELGDLHVCTLVAKISKEQFEEAKAADWVMPISVAKLIMTRERAQELWEKRGIQNSISVNEAEDLAVRRVWDEMPSGSSSWQSAFLAIRNGVI